MIGLAAVSLIHLLGLPGKLDETPWMAWMFLALIACCLATARIAGRKRLARLGRGRCAAGGCYGLTRATGLPQAHDDSVRLAGRRLGARRPGAAYAAAQ